MATRKAARILFVTTFSSVIKVMVMNSLIYYRNLLSFQLNKARIKKPPKVPFLSVTEKKQASRTTCAPTSYHSPAPTQHKPSAH
jgi:hypothetical protein